MAPEPAQAEPWAAELEALRRVTLSLTASLELESVLDAILQSALQLLPQAHAADIFVYQGGELTFSASRTVSGTPAAPAQPGSLAYTVLRTGDAVVVPDTRHHPLFAGAAMPASFGAQVGLPLNTAGPVVGVMTIAYPRPRAFPETEWRLLRLLGDLAAGAIQNAWLFETTHRQVDELTVLHLVAVAGAEATDEDALIERATHIIGAKLFPDNFGVLLLDEATGTLRLHPSYQGVSEADRRLTIAVGEGITGRVAAQGQSWRTPDVAQEPHYLQVRSGTRSELCVPLKVGERILGVINAESDRPGAFSAAHERLLVTLAGQLAIAIDRLRAEAAERRTTQRAAASRAILYQASQEISGSLDVEQVCAATHRAAARLMPCEAFMFAVLDESGPEPLIELVYAVDRGGRVPRRSGSPNEGLSGRVLAAGAAVRVADLDGEDFDARHFGGPEHVRSLVAVPLRSGEKVLGLLSAQSYTPGAYTPEDEELLTLLANQAATAIEHARLFEAEREQRQLAEVLRETGVILSASLELDDVLDRLLEQVARVVPYDTGTILLADGPVFRMARFSGYDHLDSERRALLAGLTFDPAETATVRTVIESGRPVIVADTAEFPGWIHIDASSHIRSWIGAPMVAHGQVVAVFALDKREPNFYRPRHARNLATFAGQAALAVQNARLFDAQRRRLAALTALHATGLDLGQQLDLQTLLRAIVERAVSLIESRSGGLYLMEPGADALELVVSLNTVRNLTGLRMPLGTGVAGRVAESRRPLSVGQYSAWPGRSSLLPDAPFESVLGVPIVWQDRVVGVLVATDDRPDRFAEADVEFLELFAAQAAVAIANARLYADVRAQATELGHLVAAAQEMSAGRDLALVLQALARHLCEALQATSARVLLADEAAASLTVRAEYFSERAGEAERVPTLGVTFPLDEVRPLTARALGGRTVQVLRAASAGLGAAEQQRMAAAGLQSVLLVPIVAHAVVLGLAEVSENRARREFTASDQRLAQTLVSHAADVIDNVRLLDAEQRRARHLALLNDITRTAISALDLPGLLEALAERLCRLLEADGCYLTLWDEARQLPVPAAASGRLSEIYRSLQPRPDEVTLTASALKAGTALVIEDPYNSPHLSRSIAETAGARAMLALPLAAGDRRLGAAIVAFKNPHRFTPAEVERAEQAAAQVALAIARVQLFEETQRRADELGMLVGLSGSLRQARSADDMLPILLQKACEVVGGGTSGIYLLETETGTLVLRGCHPPDPAMLGLRHQLGDGITGHVAATGEMHISADLLADPRAHVAQPVEANYLRAVKNSIAMPLRTHEGIVGVMHVGVFEAHRFTPTEIHLLTGIAEIAANALQRATLLETLEQRVAERTRELARANERLKQLDRLKDQFISNVSHELRTPLTNIKLHLGLLDKRGPDVLARYLPTLQRETERLRRLIEDLLDLSRLQAQTQPPRREPHLLDSIIAEVVALHLTRAEARDLSLAHVPGPAAARVALDRAQMLQVFNNLIGNAVSYTPAGGHVRVTTLAEARHNRAGLRVDVYNDGVVIPPEDLPHLFERFFRGRTGLDSGEAGTGLGLAICKEIVEHHEGEIGVTSTRAAGTTFSVWLPLAAE